MNTSDSLKKRYLYKLSTNFISVAIGIVIQAIIPRGLGPKAYGDFNFLTNFFSQFLGFLDTGTSIGFYTKLSQRPKEFGIVAFYSYFTTIAYLVLLMFVLAAYLTSTHKILWPGQEMLIVYLAAIWGIFAWTLQLLNKMTDAYGLTVPSEVARVIQRFLGLFLIVVLYGLHKLTLVNFFFYNYVIFIFLGGAFLWIMNGREIFPIKQKWKLSVTQIKNYSKEFYSYSHPLLFFALVGLLVGVFDRWLLQFFSGSIQQGFYGLSYQLSAVCFMFTSAMTPLLMREFSIAYDNKDISRMAVFFRRYIPALYSVAAYFSCFIALQADKVVSIFGGKEYKGAIIAVTIMAFYPIHQTYGQLSGSIFYATGQTRLYRNIGIILMLAGIPVTYFLIAPTDKLGVNSGANGLAVKMVLMQFIGVNAQLFFNARFLKLSFRKYFAHQILSVGCFLLIAAVATYGVDLALRLQKNIVINLCLSGIIYTLTVMMTAYYIPALFGLKRDDIMSVISFMKRKIGRQ